MTGPEVIDARGLRCPLPVIRLAQSASTGPLPRRVVVLATDPAAAHDIPAWCRMRGHTFVASRPMVGYAEHEVELGAEA